MLRFALILIALLAVPAQADAAQQFLGVLQTGEAVKFTAEAPTSLSRARAFSGIERGDRVVAIAPGFALGRQGKLYVLDVGSLRARVTIARVQLRGTRWTLAVSPDRRRVRIVGNAGEDYLVDARDFSVAEGPGLRLAANGALVQPAVTTLPDGRIAGVDRARRTLVTETAPGSGSLNETPLRARFPAGLDLTDPLSFAVAGNTGYAIASLGRPPRRQSRLISIDLQTGAATGESGPFFYREIVAVTPLGIVPDDTKAPSVRLLGTPKTLSLRAMARSGGVRFRVRCSEGCFVFAGTAIGGRSNIVTGRSTDMAGVLEFSLPRHTQRELRLLRLRLGKTAFIRVSARDWAGNVTVVQKRLRVTR